MNWFALEYWLPITEENASLPAKEGRGEKRREGKGRREGRGVEKRREGRRKGREEERRGGRGERKRGWGQMGSSRRKVETSMIT